MLSVADLAGTKPSDLRDQADQCDLANVSTLTCHVGAGDQVQGAVFAVDVGVVGNEGAQWFDDVQDGVSAFDDLCLAVGGHCRPRVALFVGQLSQTG